MKKELYVEGMHCKACESLIEAKLGKMKGIENVKASLSNNKIEFDSKEENPKLLKKINSAIEEHGYTAHEEKFKSTVNYKELLISLMIAIGILLLFVLIQNIGVTNLISSRSVTYPMVFLIGIVASVSTCMAVVGGLVLSISSSYARSSNKQIPLLLFHISRIVSFLILGGLLGYLGTLFSLSSSFYFLLNILLFFVMVVLAINLLDIFPFFKKLQITAPKQLTSGILKTDGVKNVLSPILLGAVTFFLPCGFTQSMQINAIASGDILQGALTMLIFALGTLPVLSLISIGSNRLAKTANSSLFFKTSGFLVLFFAIYNLLGTLVANGIIRPIF